MRNLRFTKAATPMNKGRWKTSRRIMQSFKMGEISGVDDPAQQGARVLMHKRADPVDDDPALAFVKVAFREALDQRIIDQRFCEAFYEAVKNRWTLDEAFQQALKDGTQDAQETVREYVAAVADLAQSAAMATRGLVKSADFEHQISSAVETASDEFVKAEKEPTMIKTLADLKAAIKSFDPNSATATVEASMIKSAAAILGAESELPADGALAKEAPKQDPETIALKRQVAVLSVEPTHKAYFDSLDTAGQDAFLAKDATARTADIEATKAADPVVHKCKDGTEIRKSDGAAVLAMAKRVDALATDNEALRAEKSAGDFVKQAQTEFGNLPEDGTVDLLKAAETITDPDKKKKALEALRAANKAAAPKFQRIGGGGPVAKSGGEGGGDAEAQLDTLAKAYQAANAGATFEKAYDAVIQTDEGRELYAQALGGGTHE